MRRDGSIVADVETSQDFSLVAGGSYDVLVGSSTVIAQITYDSGSLKVVPKDDGSKAKFRIIAEVQA